MSDLSNTQKHQCVERLKQIDKNENEFWHVRALAKILDYADFRNFTKVIEKAKLACEVSGYSPLDYIVEVNDMVKTGSNAERAMESFLLSRYACYLIVQNSDPTKPVIAAGQTHFAIQPLRHELQNDK